MSSFTVPEASPRTILPVTVVVSSVAFLAAAVTIGFPLRSAAAGVVLVTLLALFRPVYVGWHGLLAGLILVILFIPIRRYSLPGNLPFELEPYRLLVIVLLVALGRVAARRPPHDVPPYGFRGAAHPDLRLDRRLARREPEPCYRARRRRCRRT